MLVANKVNIKIDTLTLANNFSFTLEPGQVTAVLGPNGAGKSTLLKAIFGDVNMTSGSVSHYDDELDTQFLSSWRAKLGYMPQDIGLQVSLSVIEVVLMGRLDSLSLRIDDKLLGEGLQILNSIGMADLANRNVSSLSGGQRQMILFAQAIMRNPQIMLLDEPVSALDLHHQHVLLNHLVTQTRAKNYVSIMVLHDLNLAAQYADNLLVIKQGELVSVGSPKDVLTTELVKEIYQVEAKVHHDEDGVPFIRTMKAS
ncbi:ATP-binding cassette domain-containing protein [Vibrio toranzoniae]|uniref:ABC transporter ATP-binding protein n=1 Tax=Vibrio toranzoniae TaxID=1194427 RepID=UPI001378625C|nr:ABC transporter ATP-binding protein [Vibrio toranzoniae]NAZ55230.1 ATP-binding cassette domain-containing protein [Vibrio toranzoniae]